MRHQSLVGACLTTGDRIFATGSDPFSKCVLQSCSCFCLILGIQSWSERAPASKAYCDNKLIAILSFTFVFTVRSGAAWRQDLAILSPKGPRNSTFQLRISLLRGYCCTHEEPQRGLGSGGLSRATTRPCLRYPHILRCGALGFLGAMPPPSSMHF